MLPSIIASVIFIFLIFLCVKGIMWGASILVLVNSAFSSLVISMIFLFALPDYAHWNGQNISYLPVIVCAFMLMIGVWLMFIGQKSTNKVSDQENNIAGITAFGVGIFLGFVGFTSFCLFIFGGLSGGPDPKAAVLTFSASTFAGAVALYISTKFESRRFPNIYRWLSFLASIFLLSYVFAFSMILIFAFPSEVPASHPFWASITILNYIPISLIFVGINKNYVKLKTANNIMQRME